MRKAEVNRPPFPRSEMSRRRFLGSAAVGAAALHTAAYAQPSGGRPSGKPNVVFVFADQWRAQATPYSGDPNVDAPHLAQLASESVDFVRAVSGCPVCTPYRASLMTGQSPLTNGVFMNDVPLPGNAVTIAEAFKDAGYDTAYIGKWHLDGHGRSSYIPWERRQGWDYWKVLECTHNYNDSAYYADADQKLVWEGYDAIAQTRDAQQYIKDHANGQRPFILFVSWGPPHEPYETAPEKYRQRFRPEDVVLRPNAPGEAQEKARAGLAGYYAHIAALDDCLADLDRTLTETGIAEDTVFVFTSDHGDMHGCHGLWKKQWPYEESIRVPFLLRYPAVLGKEGRVLETPIDAPDIMPTLLGLCGLPIPGSVEGLDYSGHIQGGPNPGDGAAVIMCPQPFGQVTRKQGGREYRGIVDGQYTYVRALDGPWLLFDNENDPYQLKNLCNEPPAAEIQARLDAQLNAKLAQRRDEFLPGPVYIERFGYTVDDSGTVPYKP
ncbi:MAG TPA: sulfatase [Candidatus Hydrogenedentes bacterium]|nr:sulfatase [Candidatus Hydrogenedentota bacterium]HQE82280.1 sulfatase [Candidatus Hydrogenedentota bacterium]HQH51558.1 sulfatase [Candidatus Hydrogenedentota bacterium]HQM48814.1 sulfatase [Candidatus Hydrogenedentota bacterium]